MSHVREFFQFNPAQQDHIPAFRIAVGVGFPLLLLLGLDRLDLAIYATFGAFTGIYARNEVQRSRILRQSIAGVLLTISVTVGAALSRFDADVWAITAAGSLVSGAGAVVAARYGLRPAGSIFFIFATAAVGSIPHGAPIWVAGSVVAASAGFNILLGAGAHLLGEGRRGKDPRPLTSELSGADLAAHAARFTLAAAVAGTLGIMSTTFSALLSHPYWAMVAAVAPITPPHLSARIQRGLHRIIGTLGGLIVTAFILSFPAEPWQLVVWVIVLQFLAEVFVGRNYALALLFITPLALAMTQIAHPLPVEELVTSRAVETVIGAMVGIAVVIFGFRRERPSTSVLP